ncbi:hypothetical protein AUC43_10090 [Hymenobacter sedentarius]|uniref:Uncharacterized protein n=1 Tax=Hymenobacter sedentarius TaxID=1411621 RepID=A0A0U3SGW8_9BACT|nr:hypothetical protein AUC43_10090 [Hymenobacter sedentarius]
MSSFFILFPALCGPFEILSLFIPIFNLFQCNISNFYIVFRCGINEFLIKISRLTKIIETKKIQVG